jgi:hypothetical protein
LQVNAVKSNLKKKHMKTITKSIYPPLALIAFASFALSPQAHATCQDACLTNFNTVQGEDALISVTTGQSNTAIGADALSSTTGGGDNTGIGAFSLQNNDGFFNTATGWMALYANTTGTSNTANGAMALCSNTTGVLNTAVGMLTFYRNTTGTQNVGIGYQALYNNSSGGANTATGVYAMFKNKSGTLNTAAGFNALFNNLGDSNTAIGANALVNNKGGTNNIALGSSAGTNLTAGSNNIDIGNKGVAGEAGTIRIGTTGTQINAYVAGISGATVPTGVPVIIDTTGHLGTTTSSARYKEAIKPMDKRSEAILALKPVTFRYKHDLDPNGTLQFGLVAEDVEKVNPDLVVRDDQGKPYTVRYEAVNAMLLNEFLKEHKAFVEEQRKVQEQQAIIAHLTSAVAAQEAAAAQQQKQIDAVTTGLRKVSAQLELSKSEPRTIANNP